MATRAYILIETAVGKTREVVDALTAWPELVQVDPVTGPYDIIAVVDVDNLSTVGELVTGKIHTVAGIVRTVTCLSVAG
ncbi:MAG: DNA-binding transcriptional regulator, Lrp family [Chloroflexi bacterium]|jgi:DNA-binding Lrp family transcriptional regulator|nr:MAG: DNA-binding transcriptional regulator, Lrp family [Chloroflexota bacterium]